MNAMTATALSGRTWREQQGDPEVPVLAPFGLAYFLLVPSLGAGLLVTVAGLFAVGGLVLGARGWGAAYRGLARGLLDEPIVAPPAFVRPHGFWRSLGAMLFDGTGWRALLFLFVAFPLAILSFVVSTTFLAVGLGGISYWIWWRFLPLETMTRPPGTAAGSWWRTGGSRPVRSAARAGRSTPP